MRMSHALFWLQALLRVNGSSSDSNLEVVQWRRTKHLESELLDHSINGMCPFYKAGCLSTSCPAIRCLSSLDLACLNASIITSMTWCRHLFLTMTECLVTLLGGAGKFRYLILLPSRCLLTTLQLKGLSMRLAIVSLRLVYQIIVWLTTSNIHAAFVQQTDLSPTTPNRPFTSLFLAHMPGSTWPVALPIVVDTWVCAKSAFLQHNWSLSSCSCCSRYRAYVLYAGPIGAQISKARYEDMLRQFV